MKYKLINEKPKEGTFIRVPSNINFKINPNAFRLYVWLLSHKDGFEMNEYFIRIGIGMDYRTFRKNIKILEGYGYLTYSSKSTISSITISYTTQKIVVGLLTNKNKKQEEIKPEEKPEEKKQEKVSNASVPLTQDTVASPHNLVSNPNPIYRSY